MPTVLIIGTGILGTSIAVGLKTAGYTVIVRDKSLEAAKKAAKISGATFHDSEQILPDVVIIAAPPQATIQLVKESLAAYPDAVVMDVASTKGQIAAEIDDPRFIPTHPMAGSEKTGPLAGNGNLFQGANWVVCERNSLVENIVRDLGATPVFLDPIEHDKAVALVSHLPQLMSSLLASQLVGEPEKYVQLAGQGLRDTTRIAASNPELWKDIVSSNSEALMPLLKKVEAQLGAIDLNNVEELISTGNEGHHAIPVKRASIHKDYVNVSIAIDDRPGQLVTLLQQVAQQEINVEDMRLEHAPQQEIGVVKLLVSADEVEKLHRVLDSEWEVLGYEKE